jgi:predicted anti-sigma-YlaC factor YlaD
MSQTNCSQESAVARATRSGEWNESLEIHVRACAACRSVRETAGWMQALAQRTATEARESLPDPQILWLRAQLSERQAAAERAHKVLQWVEVACVAAACAGLGLWLAWNWSAVGREIGNGLGWALFEAWPALWSNVSAYGPVDAPLLYSSVVVGISLMTLAIAYPLAAREE